MWSTKCPLGTEPGPLPSGAEDVGHLSSLLALPNKKSGFWGGGHPWDSSVLLKVIPTAQDRCSSQSVLGELCLSLPFAVRLWASHYTSLDLSFHSCKRRTDQ